MILKTLSKFEISCISFNIHPKTNFNEIKIQLENSNGNDVNPKFQNSDIMLLTQNKRAFE
jgi:hypothetical protein